MNSELDKQITYLKGVGPKRAEMYKKMGIFTVYDLLCHYPRDYIDLTNTVPVSDSMINETVAVKGKIVRKLAPARIRKGMTVYKAVFTDGTADLTVVIYNSEYLFSQLTLDGEFYLVGRITGNLIRREMSSPLVFKGDSRFKVQPVYRLTEGLSQNVLRNNMKNALDSFGKFIYEPLPAHIRSTQSKT